MKLILFLLTMFCVSMFGCREITSPPGQNPKTASSLVDTTRIDRVPGKKDDQRQQSVTRVGSYAERDRLSD